MDEWDIFLKLKNHRKKFKDYNYWIKFSIIFYNTLYFEMKDQSEQTYQYIKSKNTTDSKELKNIIKNSPEYKKLDEITKINPEKFLEFMKKCYSDYEEILKDLMENVFEISYNEKNFVKLLNKIKTRASKQKIIIMRMSSAVLYEEQGYIESYEDKETDYSEYIN